MTGINFLINAGRAALEWNFDLPFGQLHSSGILMLPLGQLHMKQAVQHGICTLGRAVICWWPSPAQSFLFSGPVGIYEHIFFRSKIADGFWSEASSSTRGLLPSTTAACPAVPRNYSNWYIALQFLLHRKHPISIIKSNWLMLFREIVAVYCLKRTKHTNTLWGHNAGFINVKAGDVHSYHRA
jgi:hypothetical protein